MHIGMKITVQADTVPHAGHGCGACNCPCIANNLGEVMVEIEKSLRSYVDPCNIFGGVHIDIELRADHGGLNG